MAFWDKWFDRRETKVDETGQAWYRDDLGRWMKIIPVEPDPDDGMNWYVDFKGRFLEGNKKLLQVNGFRVPVPPQDKRDTWDFIKGVWVDYPEKYIHKRQELYGQHIPLSDFQEAYFEKHYEGRPEKMDALQVKRITEIKFNAPKPKGS
jgi:hypothetical protein